MRLSLESERLFLRSLNSDFAEAVTLFYRRNMDYLKEWEPNITSNFLSSYFNAKVLDFEYSNTIKSRSIRYWFSHKEAPDFLIGSVNFQNIVKGSFCNCQIGYKIDRDFGGIGLATEAVEAAIHALREDEKIHRIEAMIDAANVPSIHLVENLGFVNEGLSRKYVKINQKWKDCHRYALIFEDE